MNQTYVCLQAYEWEGSYAYSLIRGWFLHLQVGIISLPSLRSRHNIPPDLYIDEYKAPSKYATNFVHVLDMGLNYV
jgi:hypothetical protein